MDGYHNLPEATAETIVDGWLYTGDIGELTPEGNLRITDRKKDLFKTSGGKYIAPSQIESRFKAINTFVGNIVVIGAERNYCSALITFDPDLLAAHAAAVGLEGKSYAELVNAPEIKTQVEADIEELNSDLNRWETIKKFVILDQDLTIESGELTPSMKVKRKVVEENNKTAIDELYQ